MIRPAYCAEKTQNPNREFKLAHPQVVAIKRQRALHKEFVAPDLGARVAFILHAEQRIGGLASERIGLPLPDVHTIEACIRDEQGSPAHHTFLGQVELARPTQPNRRGAGSQIGHTPELNRRALERRYGKILLIARQHAGAQGQSDVALGTTAPLRLVYRACPHRVSWSVRSACSLAGRTSGATAP